MSNPGPGSYDGDKPTFEPRSMARKASAAFASSTPRGVQPLEQREVVKPHALSYSASDAHAKQVQPRIVGGNAAFRDSSQRFKCVPTAGPTGPHSHPSADELRHTLAVSCAKRRASPSFANRVRRDELLFELNSADGRLRGDNLPASLQRSSS
jgi:hypothetical protein